MIFGTLNPDKNWHENLTDLSISPVKCSHFTLGNPKSHFRQHYSYNILIIYVISQEKNCNPLAHLTRECHLLVECETFPSEWRFVAFLQMLVALKRTVCCVWQLECQASTITASVQSDHLLQFCMDTCFQSFLPLISLRCVEMQPMSQQAVAASHNSSVSLHALRSSCSMPQTQYCGYADNRKH